MNAITSRAKRIDIDKYFLYIPKLSNDEVSRLIDDKFLIKLNRNEPNTKCLVDITKNIKNIKLLDCHFTTAC